MAAPSSYEGWAHAVKPTIESRLADAEAELAFLRADNGRVARENARLRGQCERLSAEVAMLSEDPEAHARQLRRGLMGARRRDGSDVDLASTAEAAARDRPPRASREDRQLSLFLTDGKGALTERRVPGIVTAPPGVLQFGVVQAEVTSTGFVGLRPLGTNDAVNTASTSTSSVSAKMKSLMAGVLGAAGGARGDGARDEPTGAEPERADAPTRSSYEIVWKESGGEDGGGQLRRLAFECDANAFDYVREQIRSWSESATVTDRHGSADAAAAAAAAARHRRAGSNLTIDLHDGDAGDGDDGGDEGEVSKDKAAEPVKAAEGEDVVAEPQRAEEAPAGDGVRSVTETTTTTGSSHVVRPKGPKFFPVGSSGAPRILDMSDESAVCDASLAFALSRAFPARLRDSSWRLRYSTKRDGTSLRTMYRAAGSARVGEHRCEESVLLVRSSSGERFGAFTTEHWRVAPRYYGTGESFVFVLEGAGESNAEVAGSNPAAGGGGARVFPWTQRNDYFVFGRNECAAVGGGSGFALWLDEELARGNSARSDTFGNDPLSSEHEFDVACVELWTFE